MRVAIVHYWLLNRRGGERVVEALCELFPQADIFTLVADHDALSPSIRKHRLTTSFLQRIPWSRKLHRHMLPLYPLALEQFDLRGYDLVISSESGPAKGVIVTPDTCHICYCHTPMRYVWDFYHDYKGRSALGPVRKAIFVATAHYARLWDQASAARVDHFIANSENVARRVRRYYGRQAEVLYPPVEVTSARLSESTSDYYLAVGQLVGYKRFDLAIQACNRLHRPLRIIGVGEEYKRLRRLAGSTVTFLGQLSDTELRKQYSSCRALVFPGEEDFGIVPVEAQAFGRPVIAFGRGGALETILNVYDREISVPEQATGLFFQEQSIDSLVQALLSFETLESRFSPTFIQSHALRFEKQKFLSAMDRFVTEKLRAHRASCVHSIRQQESLAARVGN